MHLFGMNTFLKTPIQFLKGVGPIFAEHLKKSSLVTFWDCLSNIPQKYEIYICDKLHTIINKRANLSIIIDRLLSQKPWRFLCHTFEEEPLELVFFHKPKINLLCGSEWNVQGMITYTASRYQIIHPSLLRPWTQLPKYEQIIPQYTLPKCITSHGFSMFLRAILQQWPSVVPVWFSATHKHPSLKEALTVVHFPFRMQDTGIDSIWRQRLAYDELLAHQLALLSNTEIYLKSSKSESFAENDLEKVFIKNFGHQLTASQDKAWTEISQDLSKSTPMLRFLHGDVGSGKTIVAFLAIIRVAALNRQACLLAPTEALARQHFANLSMWLPNFPIRLVLGGKKIMGHSDGIITIGTHAILYDAVQFNSLSLVVIDEQQRFGVMQRLKLTSKGRSPHLLFLSATPIPRTYEMMLWGQIPISRLEARKDVSSIKSYLMSCENIEKLTPWIIKCIEKNQRVYWVCPVIDDEVKGVKQRWAYWAERLSFPVGCLHGRMTLCEKEQVMEDFRSGRTPLLVSTTVIEVGIDVSQASTIIIEGSEHFGLSQLHQLRGRVGRATTQGHCFFLYTPPLHSLAWKRLQFIRLCNNGFEISEKDWELRGGGTVLGTEQSGFSKFKFVDLEVHKNLLPQAVIEAKRLLKDFPDHAAMLLLLFSYESVEILKAG